jgi:hypothetical protein
MPKCFAKVTIHVFLIIWNISTAGAVHSLFDMAPPSQTPAMKDMTAFVLIPVPAIAIFCLIRHAYQAEIRVIF